MIDLIYGDCLDKMKQIPDGSIDLVLTDPPYNIGVATEISGKKNKNDWDKIDNYIDWCIEWILECQRVLKPNGVLYFFHNDILQIAEILHKMTTETQFKLRSFCVWDKGDSYRAFVWYNRHNADRAALKCWFGICEYCLHFFKQVNPSAGLSLTHNCDPMHCNIWHVKPIISNNRYHTCQKPVEILRRLIRVSSNPGDVVLDPFMGSGSTGVACLEENRKFIGIEKEEQYYKIAHDRIFEK